MPPGALAIVLLLAAATAAGGHPSPLPAGASPDPVRPGMSEAELHALTGEMLQGGLLSASEASAAGSGLAAFHRRFASGEDLAYAEYELFQGRVYRVRWRLAERFERPLYPALATTLSQRLGPPFHDQVLEAEFGSGRASLRRAVWRWSGGVLELRQLQPLRGGALLLTWLDEHEVQKILAAGQPVPPQPDRLPPWWQGKPSLLAPLDAHEEEELVHAVEALLASWLRRAPQ